MAVPHNHTLIPLNIIGIQMLESILNTKLVISNKTVRHLHLLLRHGDDADNCNTGGFFYVSYVISYFQTSIKKLVNTVYNNNKNRYQFSIFNKTLYIRACQGHSGKILNKLIPEHIYILYLSDNNVFHRTTNDISNSIFSLNNTINGLRPMGRQVHMTLDEKLSRNSDKYPIKIIINVKKAREKGIVFWKSLNNIVLSYDKIPKNCLYLDI